MKKNKQFLNAVNVALSAAGCSLSWNELVGDLDVSNYIDDDFTDEEIKNAAADAASDLMYDAGLLNDDDDDASEDEDEDEDED